MKLKEFDAIRKYLPDDTEIEIKVEQTEPGIDEVWAVELCSWSNDDGPFSVVCAACGNLFPLGIPPRQRTAMTLTYEHKACPKCGRKFIKKGDIRR